MAISGFKLTFDDGTEFRCSSDVDVTHDGEMIYLLDGRSNLVALFNQFLDDQGGQPGRSDSNMSSVFAGFGAGVHTIDVSFTQAADTTDTWGAATSGDSTAVELRDRLVRALTTIRMDSQAVGLLEVGEFSSSGIYSAIPVTVVNFNVGVQVTEGRPSEAFGSITFGDSVDVNRAVDALERVG